MHPAEPPRLQLANLPTPLVELTNLARLAGVPRILLKRDDLTGLETSGNGLAILSVLVVFFQQRLR